VRVTKLWVHGANNVIDPNHHAIEKKPEEKRRNLTAYLDFWRGPAPYELVLPTTGFAGHAYCEAKIKEVSHHDAPRYEAGHYTAHKVLVRHSRS
jgi:hypothetical protein